MIRWLPLMLVALSAGCFFRDSGSPRYFRPELAAVASPPEPNTRASSTGLPLRLRSVHASPFLRERMVWRTSPLEYGLYEQRRWSELPTTYADRTLTSALVGTSVIRFSDDMHAPELYAEVTAFDEVLAPTHFANVAMAVSLFDASGRRFLERTFSSDVPIGDDDPSSVARAIGHGLDDVCTQAAESVATALRHEKDSGGAAAGRRRHGKTAQPSASQPRP